MSHYTLVSRYQMSTLGRELMFASAPYDLRYVAPCTVRLRIRLARSLTRFRQPEVHEYPRRRCLGTLGAYIFNAQCAAGSATINIHNATPGALNEQPVVQFVLIKRLTT